MAVLAIRIHTACGASATFALATAPVSSLCRRGGTMCCGRANLPTAKRCSCSRPLHPPPHPHCRRGCCGRCAFRVGPDIDTQKAQRPSEVVVPEQDLHNAAARKIRVVPIPRAGRAEVGAVIWDDAHRHRLTHVVVSKPPPSAPARRVAAWRPRAAVLLARIEGLRADKIRVAERATVNTRPTICARLAVEPIRVVRPAGTVRRTIEVNKRLHHEGRRDRGRRGWRRRRRR